MNSTINVACSTGVTWESDISTTTTRTPSIYTFTTFYTTTTTITTNTTPLLITLLTPPPPLAYQRSVNTKLACFDRTCHSHGQLDHITYVIRIMKGTKHKIISYLAAFIAILLVEAICIAASSWGDNFRGHLSLLCWTWCFLLWVLKLVYVLSG